MYFNIGHISDFIHAHVSSFGSHGSVLLQALMSTALLNVVVLHVLVFGHAMSNAVIRQIFTQVNIMTTSPV